MGLAEAFSALRIMVTQPWIRVWMYWCNTLRLKTFWNQTQTSGTMGNPMGVLLRCTRSKSLKFLLINILSRLLTFDVSMICPNFVTFQPQTPSWLLPTLSQTIDSLPSLQSKYHTHILKSSNRIYIYIFIVQDLQRRITQMQLYKTQLDDTQTITSLL